MKQATYNHLTELVEYFHTRGMSTMADELLSHLGVEEVDHADITKVNTAEWTEMQGRLAGLQRANATQAERISELEEEIASLQLEMEVAV